jgi:hypothetical protein
MRRRATAIGFAAVIMTTSASGLYRAVVGLRYLMPVQLPGPLTGA